MYEYKNDNILFVKEINGYKEYKNDHQYTIYNKDAPPTTVASYCTHDIGAAPGVLDAEPDVALVVDGVGVGELVGLEAHGGRGLAAAVLELPQDFVVNRTTESKRHSFLNGVVCLPCTSNVFFE